MSAGGMAARHAPAAMDMELVRAVRAEDDDAFEELYRRYRTPVARFVRRFVRDEGRAEDITQEVFVSALRGLRQTDSEIRFKPWLYEIARNAAIDHLRRTSRAEEVPLDLDGGLDATAGLRMAGPTAPEASVIDRERLLNVWGALDELSDTHHRIILMRELEGLSYREIGARMQLSSAAVESALFRARRKLESEYEQLDTGRRCAAIRTLIARLAEGVDSGADRRRLDRHARHCWSCRRLARELGVQPVAPRLSARRAGALLPLPAFLRRWGAEAARPTGAGAREATGVIATPAGETLVQGAHKAVAVLASAVAIGAGGATLGGSGPLAVKSGDVVEGRATARALGSERTPPEKAPGSGAEAGESSRAGLPAADGDGGGGTPATAAPAGEAKEPGRPAEQPASSVPGLPGQAVPDPRGAPAAPGGDRVLGPLPLLQAPPLAPLSLPTAPPPSDLPVGSPVPDVPALTGASVDLAAGALPEVDQTTAGLLPPP